MRYQPQSELVEVLYEDISAANSEIISLQAEIERLSEFEAKNLELEEELQSKTIHLTLLSARAAVADASLAIEQDRKADAKLALDKTGNTLEVLKELLTDGQADVVDNMIQRHSLIMIEFEDDSFSLQTDLELLQSKLSMLEATLFASP
jgi:hypothetical protein